MTLHQFFRILRARFWLALLVFVVIVGATVAVNLLLPNQYTARAVLLLDVRSPDPVSGIPLQGLIAPGYIATQVDIINSARVAKDVVQKLGLDNNPAVRQQWLDDTGGEGQLLDWLAALLQKNLEVKPARESSVINVDFTSTEPKFTAAVANAFAQSYMGVNLDLRVGPARKNANFFEDQTRSARLRLETAQKQLSDYQQKHGLTSYDERLDYETARLAETSSQLTALQAQTTDAASKRQNRQGANLVEVMQSPLINGLKADVARLQARLTENNVNLGANHPQTLRQTAELDALKAQLDKETRQILSSVDTTFEVGRGRERMLQGALASQRARVMALNKQRDDSSVFRRDVESAQRNFDLVSLRASQTGIESQTSETNIALLTPVITPVKPSQPRIVINVAASVVLGGLLAIGLALLVETLRRKIRSADDLTEVFELPLLGAVGSARGLIRRSPLRIQA